MLLRDAPATQGSIEVFMVQRHGLSDVLGGAFVFPGGKIDADDAAPALLARLHGASAQELAARLGEPDDHAAGAAMVTGAMRETFEEAGVLHFLGRDAGRSPSRAALQEARAKLNAGQAFSAVVAELDVQLDAAALAPWARWVTPDIAPKRFDARFFFAAMPPDQEAIFDPHETTEGRWVKPAEALELFLNGAEDAFPLAPPTYKTLESLANFATVQAALTAARSRIPPIIMPVAHKIDGERVLAFPGDSLHPVSTPALDGETRLVWKGTRFTTISKL
jgi:8-oxo-dGTP pyrophosphatase MutT (NUDIX family)